MTNTATSRVTINPPPRTRLERACEIAFTAQPFRANTTQLCAGFTTPGHATRAVAIRSREFIEWIRDTFAHRHGEIPSVYTLREARNAFEARAWFANEPHRRVARRVLGYGREYLRELEPGAIVIDLARPDGRVIEITSAGWRDTPGQGHTFYKHPAALPLPLPRPADGGPTAALDTLRRLLGVRSNLHWRRVLIWLVNAMRPVGPYPILAFHGPANSGKTRAVRRLRHLIDPVTTPLTPASPEALGKSIRRAAHHLKGRNITAEFRRSNPNRTVTLTRSVTVPPLIPASFPQIKPQNCHIEPTLPLSAPSSSVSISSPQPRTEPKTETPAPHSNYS